MSGQERVPKQVTVIPATKQVSERDFYKEHLRVAPYCRVSSKKDEQLNSYEAQIQYYTEKINSNPDWEMVRMYADEGISGTSMKKRKQFNQLMKDAEKGKIDLVVTKSVSRFGRNTLDGLTCVRRLRQHGVGVLFEKENVNTLYMDNEMILTFMMSQAQEESASMSKIIRWGQVRRFEKGKVSYHYDSFLGYKKGADGEPEIDEEQAAVVRRIFARYLMGHSTYRISKDLMADGIETARGNSVWSSNAVRAILQNEKYMGDALLQKTYCSDFFTHQRRMNNGELPKYYVHDCHPAIIDRATFQKAQEEMARRASLRKTSSRTKTELGKFSGKYAFTELLVCGECGSPYRRVLWMPNGKRRYVWRCINRLEHGKRICKGSPTLEEPELQTAVTAAMNEMFHQREARRITMDCVAQALASAEGQELSLPVAKARLQAIEERQNELLALVLDASESCTDYDKELMRLVDAKTALTATIEELDQMNATDSEISKRVDVIAAATEQEDGALDSFNDSVARQLISCIRVVSRDQLVIRFKDGSEVQQAIEHNKEGKTA